MASIARADGTEFIIRAYRETLTGKNTAKLKANVCELAKDHGEYVALFKQGASKLEAIFSRKQGVLLGESIWDYFNRPQNLIYCEALADTDEALLVVIRDHTVFLDTKLPLDDIVAEFAPIISGKRHYHLCVYGDVPITEIPQAGKFSLAPERVVDFEQLSVPLFPNLPAKTAFRLQPLSQILRHRYLRSRLSFTSLVLIVLALSIGLWWYFTAESELSASTAKPKQILVDPYQAHDWLLIAPAPEQQLAELVDVINLANGLEGWRAQNVSLTDKTYQIPLNNAGGTREYLRQWARTHAGGVTFTAQGVILSIYSRLTNREEPAQIHPLAQVVNHVSATIKQILPHAVLAAGGVVQEPQFKQTTLDMRFDQITLNALTLLGQQLNNLPVSLVSVKVTEMRGLLSGEIKFVIGGL